MGHPDAWGDPDQAQRAIDAIEESGSDSEAEWVRIVGEIDGLAEGGVAGAVADATDRDEARASEHLDAAAWLARAEQAGSRYETVSRERREAAVRAVRLGATKVDAAAAARVTRTTLDAWLARD